MNEDRAQELEKGYLAALAKLGQHYNGKLPFDRASDDIAKTAVKLKSISLEEQPFDYGACAGTVCFFLTHDGVVELLDHKDLMSVLENILSTLNDDKAAQTVVDKALKELGRKDLGGRQRQYARLIRAAKN